MHTTISVIICAYTVERWERLTMAVESVKHQTLPAGEIIVVIDYNPALLARAQDYFSDVLVIENNNAKGLSGARNSGWSKAQGEIVAFLDDDAIARPDWLEKLAGCYVEQHVAGVGGKIIPLWESSRPAWFPEEFNWVVGSTYPGMPTQQARTRNVIGANMSVRRNILAATGGFREYFGCDKAAHSLWKGLKKWLHHHAGDEETEFCIRVTQQFPDQNWLYTPLAVVQHTVPVQRTRWKYFVWRCYDEGLGKANLVKLHHASTGLSSERTYTFKTLPAGFAHDIVGTFLHADPTEFLRAWALLIGLTTTIAGYCVGCVSLLYKEYISSTMADHHLIAEYIKGKEIFPKRGTNNRFPGGC